jgi:23S rRNA (adenine2503-C2)-methyltransferase
VASPLLIQSFEDLRETLGGPGRAKAVLAILRRGLDPFSEGDLAPKARARLLERCLPTPIALTKIDEAEDGTVKVLVGLRDGRSVEMVAIPGKDRTTLCVSSQVGCVRGCSFCLTATMGLVRNLEAEEIVAQVVAGLRLVRERALPALRNLVLMGMGEPLDNLENVAAALRVITGSDGLGIGPRHVTVSTVAPSPRAVKKAAALPAYLAWSLHAADDDLRRRLVPTARHSPATLLEAFAEVLGEKGDPLFVEIALIQGVNDDLAAADRAADLLRGFPTEARVNLLPMNPIGRGDLLPSPPDRVLAFRDRLIERGLLSTVRRSRGSDRNAACGQLVTSSGSHT